jgi:hypothetical protein
MSDRQSFSISKFRRFVPRTSYYGQQRCPACRLVIHDPTRGLCTARSQEQGMYMLKWVRQLSTTRWAASHLQARSRHTLER